MFGVPIATHLCNLVIVAFAKMQILPRRKDKRFIFMVSWLAKAHLKNQESGWVIFQADRERHYVAKGLHPDRKNGEAGNPNK